MSKTEILNVNAPGRTTRVDTDEYEAMRAAILEVTPAGERVGATVTRAVADAQTWVDARRQTTGDAVRHPPGSDGTHPRGDGPAARR